MSQAPKLVIGDGANVLAFPSRERMQAEREAVVVLKAKLFCAMMHGAELDGPGPLTDALEELIASVNSLGSMGERAG